VCRRLRNSQPNLPIIVVSGRSDDLDRILGLELGADDYVTKPFVPRELVARIKALHRRSAQLAAPESSESAATDSVRFGPYVIDLRRRELSRNGLNVSLTNSEFDLLSVFCRNPGQLLRRSDILGLLAVNPGGTTSERGIDVTVVRLRKLLEEDPKAPTYIKTVWRVGYVFTP
jgi:two-component system phosphate regulon response regulator OmpR